MGIETFQTLAVVALGLLPGAAYVWAYERQVGVSRAGLADRALRLVGASAMLSPFTLPLMYQLYRRFVVTGILRNGEALPPTVWLLPAGLLLAPSLLGFVVGRAARHRSRWVQWFRGPTPAPRAWDYLFSSPGLTGWVRLKLKDGTWAFGAWSTEEAEEPSGLRSYAAGYPEPQDLYFVDTATIDEDGIVHVDEDGNLITRNAGLLVRWDEIAYAEFFEG